jgi:hypothetical protein
MIRCTISAPFVVVGLTTETPVANFNRKIVYQNLGIV